MQEKIPSHNNPEQLPPRLAIELVQTSRLFADTLISHSTEDFDWKLLVPDDYTPGEIDHEGKSGKLATYFEMQYGASLKDEDNFLGDLLDWDAKLLSFKTENQDPLLNFASYRVFFPLEPVRHPALEISYFAHFQDKDKRGVDVVIPFEGQAKIKEKGTSHNNGATNQKDDEWRPMTKAEGEALLVDLGDAVDKLNSYLDEGKEVKF